MPPEMYERVYVGGRRQQQVVPPLIVADVQTAILVHPADKLKEWRGQRDAVSSAENMLPNLLSNYANIVLNFEK